MLNQKNLCCVHDPQDSSKLDRTLSFLQSGVVLPHRGSDPKLCSQKIESDFSFLLYISFLICMLLKRSCKCGKFEYSVLVINLIFSVKRGKKKGPKLQITDPPVPVTPQR